MAKTTDSQAILQAFRDNDRLGARKVFNKVMAERASVELTKMQQTVAKQLQECARCGDEKAIHETENSGFKDAGANDASTKGSVASTICGRCGKAKKGGQLLCPACTKKHRDGAF